MITQSELGLTTEQYDELKSSIMGGIWKLTAYRWNLKFDSSLDSTGIETGYDWDAANHDSTIYRINGNHAEKIASGVWTNVGTFVPLSGLILNYSIYSSGSTLYVFGANTTGISRCTWNGTVWSSWTEIVTLASIKYLAAVDENTVHYIHYDDTTKLWNLRVAKYSGSWASTSSDIHWQYPIRSFDAVKLGATDVLTISAQAPGNLSAEYIDGQAVKTTVPSSGVFAFLYRNSDWSDHFIIDLVDEERTWKNRKVLNLSLIDSTLYLTCYSSSGTQSYPYRNYRLYTSKDGRRWSRGQFMALPDYSTYGIKLLRLGTSIYALERNSVHISKSTLFTGSPDSTTYLDITNEVRSNIQVSRRDMAQIRVSISNSTDWISTSILDGNSTVVLKLEAGYRISGVDTYVQLGLYEVDSIERTEDLPDHTVELTGRDFLARMAGRTQSEEFFQWEPQFGGGDEYKDYTGTDKGGLGNTAVMSGSWGTPDNSLVLLSKDKEGVSLSVLLSDQWNGVQEHSFKLVNAANNEYAGVLFRGQDKDNFYGLVYDQALDKIKIIQRVGGSDTALWTAGSTISWSGTPSTRRWLRVKFRYARVIAWTSSDGITWTQQASILTDGQPDVTYDAYGYPVVSAQKMFKGLVGVIGKGYSDEDVFDYTAPTYGAPTYGLPDYPTLNQFGSLAAYSTDETPTKMFMAAATSAQAAIATGITTGGTFTWTEISSGLSGNPIWGSSDPYSYDVMYLLTDTGIYKCTPYTFAGWTLVANNLTMFGNATYVGSKIVMSINRQGWMYVISGTSMAAWSNDYGATWTNNGGSAGTGDSAYGQRVALSPFNDGASAVGWMYKAVYTGSGSTTVYKSTDWGVTWSSVSTVYGGWVTADINVPYKRGSSVGGGDNVNDASQWIIAAGGASNGSNSGGTYRSVNAGGTWGTISYAAASGITRPATSLRGQALQSFTYDGDIIFMGAYLTGAAADVGRLLAYDNTTETLNTGNRIVPGENSICVNGFSYHSGAILAWSTTKAYAEYTFNGGTNLYAINLPAFFSASPQAIGYVEWPLIDQWTPPS